MGDTNPNKSLKKDADSSLSSIDESVSMISVCRLLAALESELGSLASKALNLLALTIEVNKSSQDNPDGILLKNKENLIFLEVVKEKMKGLLIVEIYSTQKRRAINNLIQNIDQLIEQTVVDSESSSKSPSDQKTDNNDPKTAHGKDESTKPNVPDPSQDIKLISSTTIAAPKIKTEKTEKLVNLSDEELKTLIDNFSYIIDEEKLLLLEFMENLEKTNPLRVKRLSNIIKFDKLNEDRNDVIIIEDDDDKRSSV